MSTEWDEVFIEILAERDLLSRWEIELVEKCQCLDSGGYGLTQDRKTALLEIYYERVVEKIPSRNRQEE